jgi:hypothetical protein
LWELYGHHLDYFDELVELEVATVVEDFLPFRFFQAPQRRRQYMRELSEREQEYPGSKLRTVVDFLFRVHEDWDEFNRCWQSAGGRHWTNGGFDDNAHIFPFQKGLKYLVTGLYENALQDESLKAYQFMSNLPIELDNEYPQPDVEDEYQHESFGVRYLLAPAGSGKTHMMFNALKKNLGFYLVSGAAQAAQMNLSPPADQLNGEQYFCPNAMGASADTRLLFEIVQLDHNIVNKGLSPFSLSEMHWRALQENRLRFLFEVVKQAQKNRTSVQPWRWLYFQLSCGINADPFLRLYRILALREGIHYKGQNHLPMSNIRAQAQKFLPKILWCFDEVQYEASTTLPSLPPAGCEGFMLVSFMVSWFRLGESNSAILGGTALNQKMIESKLAEARLDGVIDRRTEASRGHLNAEILTTDFDFFDGVIREATPFGQSRLLNDDETFRILLRATVVSIFNVLWVAVGEQGSTYRRMTSALLGVEAISENSSFIRKFGLQRTGHGIFVGLDRAQAVAKMLRGFEDLHGQIIRHSIPFRGRFRWSVCYIVTLLEIFIEYGYLTEMLTRHVSESVQQTLREPLVRRISLLASTKKDLAEHIFEMALQADLFGRSRILDDDNAAVLIEQAIGSIENISNSKGKKTFQVYLSERLVVEAVIQYLRNGNLLEDRALTYLRRCQYNASEMGFYAEEYLPRLMHAKTLPQRREFLTAFDTVYTISPTSALIPEQLGLEGYSLESVPGKISLEQSGDKDVHTWLREVCDNTPRATFLLPSTFAGPDVMFVVCKEVQGRKKRLICAVQVWIICHIVVVAGANKGGYVAAEDWTQNRYRRACAGNY